MRNCFASPPGKIDNRQGCYAFYVFIQMLQYTCIQCIQYQYYLKQILHGYLTTQIFLEIGRKSVEGRLTYQYAFWGHSRL